MKNFKDIVQFTTEWKVYSLEMMVWIIFTLIIVVSFVGSTFLKNNIFNKLLKDMQKQDFDTFLSV